MGTLFGLARFSEAFLILRAYQSGIAMALVPLVMVAMNVVYAASAYPFGKLSDRVNRRHLLAAGLALLVLADGVLASSTHWAAVLGGVALWGMHMGITQGLLATLVAATAPEDLRGTAFGVYNLLGGLALFVASAGAGLLWSRWGAAAAFGLSAGFGLLALLLLARQPSSTAPGSRL